MKQVDLRTQALCDAVDFLSRVSDELQDGSTSDSQVLFRVLANRWLSKATHHKKTLSSYPSNVMTSLIQELLEELIEDLKANQ